MKIQAISGWKGMDEVKNIIKPGRLGNQEGGISIMLISLFAMIFCVAILVVCMDYVSLYNKTNKLKNDLNAAVHAATLSYDKDQLTAGFFKLDTTTLGYRAQDMFYKYLQLNMNLDSQNRALPGSRLPNQAIVNVDELLYVDSVANVVTSLTDKQSNCSYDSNTHMVNCTVLLNGGSDKEISRTINQKIIGPSIVAIINTYHKGLGVLSDEPLLIPAVQEVDLTIR
ncbi:hypothetical protein ACLBWT_18700 [Paenibacillus sp. D51F]